MFMTLAAILISVGVESCNPFTGKGNWQAADRHCHHQGKRRTEEDGHDRLESYVLYLGLCVKGLEIYLIYRGASARPLTSLEGH